MTESQAPLVVSEVRSCRL